MVTVVRDPYAETWTLSTAVADGAGAAVDNAADGSMLRPKLSWVLAPFCSWARVTETSKSEGVLLLLRVKQCC